MRGSLRGGASQIQQTSSTPAATEEEEDKRGGPGKRWERGGEGDGVDRETEQSAALIYVY